jgi:Fe2+ or Zn2+ uptake regulation protein
MRTSAYKEKILSVLSKKHLLSVAEIKKLVGADFSTVFRNLESLVKEGEIKKIVISKDSVMYEKSEGHAHDHFVCDDCGKVESLEISHNNLKISGSVKDILVRGSCGECV